jgi:hypothetical protein
MNEDIQDGGHFQDGGLFVFEEKLRFLKHFYIRNYP